MNAIETQPISVPTPAWIGFLRQSLTIYSRVSLVAMVGVLYVIASSPDGLSIEPQALVSLAAVYFFFWTGPFFILFVFASGSNRSEMEALFCGLVSFGAALFVLLAFLVRSRGWRTVLLSVSAAIWFGAVFLIFLGESM